jgi:transposase
MTDALRQVPYAPLLRSIPQLGVVTVATLLGELGDLNAYRHAKQVIAMAGLDLVENSSGERQGHHHMLHGTGARCSARAAADGVCA